MVSLPVVLPVPPSRPPLRRPVQGRVVAGVATGTAQHLGLPVWPTRIAFLVLLGFGGAGLVGYTMLWIIVPQDGSTRAAATTLESSPTHGRPAAQAAAQQTVDAARRATVDSEPVRLLFGGAALIVMAGVLIANRFGLNVPWPVVIPVLVVVAGAVLGLSQLDSAERQRWLAPVSPTTPAGMLRLIGGLLLVTSGLIMLLAPTLSGEQLLLIAVAALAVLLGTGLVLGPWALRLWRDLEAERGLRARAQERSEIAAHLHDSVLHTLSLIQRRPGDADEVARLARAQERQLREWLYSSERPQPEADETVAVAVRRTCAEVEDGEGVPVEVVVVGDAPCDPASSALVKALREALLNAVRHGRVGGLGVRRVLHRGPGGVRAGPRAGLRPRGRPAGPVGGTQLGHRQDGAPRWDRSSAAGSWGRYRGGPTAPPHPREDRDRVARQHPRERAAMNQAAVRVVLVDDHRLFRSGVRSELSEADAGLQVVDEAGDVDEAVEAVRTVQPDVVLLDVHLPGGDGGGGAEVLRRCAATVSAAGCPVRFLALSVSDAAEDVIAVIRAGARGYVTKSITGVELAAAVRRVADGDAVFSPRLAGFVLDAFGSAAGEVAAVDDELDRLSVREREVMRLIARGYAYKEVAKELFISVKTVETHVSAVLRKLQLSRRHELTRWAADRRLL